MPVDRPSEEAVARGTSTTPVDDDDDDAEKDSSGVIMCTSHPPNLAAAESLPEVAEIISPAVIAEIG